LKTNTKSHEITNNRVNSYYDVLQTTSTTSRHRLYTSNPGKLVLWSRIATKCQRNEPVSLLRLNINTILTLCTWDFCWNYSEITASVDLSRK